jgi:PUA domain protein
MAPGLTSAGGRLPSGDEGEAREGEYKGKHLEKGQPVVVRAEGKEEACLVGILSMGTKDIKVVGKGPVVEEGHYLGDGLWRLAVD